MNECIAQGYKTLGIDIRLCIIYLSISSHLIYPETQTPSQCIYAIFIPFPFPISLPLSPNQNLDAPIHLLRSNRRSRLGALSSPGAGWLVVDAVEVLERGVDLLVVLLDGADDLVCDVLEGEVGAGGGRGGLLNLCGGHCDCLFCLCEARLDVSEE